MIKNVFIRCADATDTKRINGITILEVFVRQVVDIGSTVSRIQISLSHPEDYLYSTYERPSPSHGNELMKRAIAAGVFRHQ